MPMTKQEPMATREEIVHSLKMQATELWGAERAEGLQTLIEQTAAHIWQLSQDLPFPDEEPGFYF